jgi:hypothetical protein
MTGPITVKELESMSNEQRADHFNVRFRKRRVRTWETLVGKVDTLLETSDGLRDLKMYAGNYQAELEGNPPNWGKNPMWRAFCMECHTLLMLHDTEAFEQELELIAEQPAD